MLILADTRSVERRRGLSDAALASNQLYASEADPLRGFLARPRLYLAQRTYDAHRVDRDVVCPSCQFAPLAIG